MFATFLVLFYLTNGSRLPSITPPSRKSHSHKVPNFLRRRDAHGEYIETDAPVLTGPVGMHLKATAEITITPQGPTNSSTQIVTLAWSGLDNANKTDWFGFYSPANSSSEDYLDYFYNTNSTSSGSEDFLITNLRTDLHLLKTGYYFHLENLTPYPHRF